MARLCALFGFLGLLVFARGQHNEHFLLVTTDSPTNTPGVITNPNSNATSTEAYQSTSFPIWSTSAQTTEHTPNVTSSGTSTQAPSTTPTPTMPTSTMTTTQNPNHTTTESPTTPVTPTVPVPTLPPEPVAPSFPWNVTYGGGKGNYCAMLSFAARIDISYINVLNQVVQTGLDVPDNATVNANKSSCEPGQAKEVFVLDFESSASGMGSLAVTFHRDGSTNDSTIFEVHASVLVTEDLFPGISPAYLGQTVMLSATNLTMFDTEPAHSYSCASLLKTNLTMVQMGVGLGRSGRENKLPFQSGTLETSNLKAQAFMPSDQKIDTFLPDTVCPEDKTDISSTIPITVGVILLFMVVVVLIAYFIGRSRQQKETTTI